VEVIADIDEGSKILDFLFADIESSPVFQSHRQLRLIQTTDGIYQITICDDKNTSVCTTNRNEALRLLMDKAIYCLAEPCDSGLLFHAAVVAKNGHAIVMPAASGAGKSTLSCWLVKQGFGYCTDELGFLATNSNQVDCFTRPVILKNSAREVMTPLLGLGGLERTCYQGPVAMMVPRQHLNPEFITNCPEVALFVFPNYQPYSDFQCSKLTAAQVGMRLMSLLVNARNLHDHGFSEVSRIARHAPACEIRYSSFAQIEKHYSAIFDEVSMADQLMQDSARNVPG